MHFAAGVCKHWITDLVSMPAGITIKFNVFENQIGKIKTGYLPTFGTSERYSTQRYVLFSRSYSIYKYICQPPASFFQCRKLYNICRHVRLFLRKYLRYRRNIIRQIADFLSVELQARCSETAIAICSTDNDLIATIQ